MIIKKVFMEIKAMYRNGKSIRAIAKEMGLHRKTVKKHLAGDEFPRYNKIQRQESILAPYFQTIQDYLEEDDYKATWILDRLKNRDYAGGYDTVKRYVQTIKARKMRLAYARFETDPGRQAQFDWGDFQIVEPAGRTTTVYVFILVLGFSRAAYTEFVERCTLESFMDGHIRAFRFLQGVPAEILFDYVPRNIIKHDSPRHPADMVKDILHPLTDAHRRLAPEGLDERRVAVGEAEAEVFDRPDLAADPNIGFPKIPLGHARRPDQLQIARLSASISFLFFQIALDQGMRAAVLLWIFGLKTLMDASGRMALFEAHPPILFQPLVDLRLPGIQFRRGGFGGPRLAVEVFLAHVLGDGLSVEVQPAGDLLRSQPLALQVFDLVNLVYSEHVSSLQGILQGFPVDSSP